MQPVVGAVDAFVRCHGPPTASAMADLGRPHLAALVAALPSSPLRALDAAQRALPHAAFAAALAAAAAAVHDAAVARPQRWQQCVEHADVAMCFGGRQLAEVLLPLIDHAEARIAEVACGEEGQEDQQRQQQPCQKSHFPDGFSGAGPTTICVHPPAIATETIPCVQHDLTVDQFRDQFFQLDVPVLLRGAALDWPAVGAWKHPTYLLRMCGHRTVPVEISLVAADQKNANDSEADNRLVEEAFVPFRELLYSMMTSSSSSSTNQNPGRRMYLAQHPLFDYIPRLADDFRVPKYVQAAGTDEKDVRTNVWFGSTGTGTRLHYDSADNLLAQVVGRKHVTLFDASQRRYLYVTDETANFSPVQVDNPDFVLHPDFKSARAKTCILEPGDILYIPSNVWHWIRALSPSCSINFWF